MSGFGFQPDRKIIDFIREEKFTLSAEVIPPRNGMGQEELLETIGLLIRSGAQFLSVTKGAGGSLRAGSLPIALAIKERFGVPAVAHFTCRDLVPEEIENLLMDHHYFGIRNILALRGDPPQDQPDWIPRAGSFSYAHQLIEMIKKLNEGSFLSRKIERTPEAPKTQTDFSIGCAVYPEHEDELERIDFFKRKVDAGADYAITQMCFDADAYSRFLDEAGDLAMKTPILPGIRVLSSQKQAQSMAKRFSVAVPLEMMKALPEDPKKPGAAEKAVEVSLRFLDKLKKRGAPGAHVFILSEPTLGSALIKQCV